MNEVGDPRDMNERPSAAPDGSPSTVAIWKYSLGITDQQVVEMPEAARILTVQMQNGSLCLWALVDPLAPKRGRKIEIIGTGNPAEHVHRRYISTVQMAGGSLVWHIFERQ